MRRRRASQPHLVGEAREPLPDDVADGLTHGQEHEDGEQRDHHAGQPGAVGRGVGDAGAECDSREQPDEAASELEDQAEEAPTITSQCRQSRDEDEEQIDARQTVGQVTATKGEQITLARLLKGNISCRFQMSSSVEIFWLGIG